MEHCHDAAHESGHCTLCMFAEMTAMTASQPPPLIEMGAAGDFIVAELPAVVPAPCHSAFGPRSPPCVAPCRRCAAALCRRVSDQ